jgi:hypothetical protein
VDDVLVELGGALALVGLERLIGRSDGLVLHEKGV